MICTGCPVHRFQYRVEFYGTLSESHDSGNIKLQISCSIIIIIIDNFYIALFSGVPKLTALYILQHFLSFTNIIHIIMTTNNV